MMISILFAIPAAFAQSPTAPAVIINDRPPSLEEILRIRDPFKQPDLSRYRKQEGVKTELEQYPVTDYKMLGVITGPKRMRAMVRGPNEKTYFVRKGQKIGTQNGKIHRITPEAVVIHEQVENLLGQSETVVTELRLPVGGKIDVIGGGEKKEEGNQDVFQQVVPGFPAPGGVGGVAPLNPSLAPIQPGVQTGFGNLKPADPPKDQSQNNVLNDLKKAIADEVSKKLKEGSKDEKKK